MAKIGNESRLILKLADERMKNWLNNRQISDPDEERRNLRVRAVAQYGLTLNDIVAELERG